MITRHPVSNRGDWLALRRGAVTASDVAALFDCHPYRTRLQVYADKIGAGHDRGDNAAMRAGRILEPSVAAAVQEEHPQWRIVKATEYLCDPDVKIGATPDYFIEGDPRGLGVLQCKKAKPDIYEREWKPAPMAYVLQTLTEMMLSGAAFGVLGVILYPSFQECPPVFTVNVPRHAATEAKIVAAVKAFWAAVERGEQPPAADARDHAALASLYPRERDDGEVLDLSGDNYLPALLEERETLKARMSTDEDRCGEIDAEIKAKLGEHAVAHAAGWRLSWKTQSRKETVLKATSFRVLRCTRTKDNPKPEEQAA